MFDAHHPTVAGRRPVLLLAIAVAVAFPVIALGSPVDVPNAFTDGNVIAAAEFNENFDAVADAVNDNDARIAALEAAIDGAGVPVGTIAFFATAACPAGWAEHADLRGRVPLGLPSAGTVSALVGTALDDEGTRTITQVPTHVHSVDPPNTTAVSESSHTHSVNPGPFDVTTENDGSHTHTVSGWSAAGASARLDWVNNGTGTTSFTTAGTGNHTHTFEVDVPSTPSLAGSSHTHDVNIGAFNSANNTGGVASVDVTMPYVQLLACAKQ